MYPTMLPVNVPADGGAHVSSRSPLDRKAPETCCGMLCIGYCLEQVGSVMVFQLQARTKQNV